MMCFVIMRYKIKCEAKQNMFSERKLSRKDDEFDYDAKSGVNWYYFR